MPSLQGTFSQRLREVQEGHETEEARIRIDMGKLHERCLLAEERCRDLQTEKRQALAELDAVTQKYNRLRMERTLHDDFSTLDMAAASARVERLRADRVDISQVERDNVVLRSQVEDLRRETGVPPERVVGIPCDVTEAADVARLARLAERALSPVGGVRVWVNNAAASGSFQPFLDAAPSTLGAVIQLETRPS